MFWTRTKEEFLAASSMLRPIASIVEPWLASQDVVQGWCCRCQRIVHFQVGPREEDWRNLREGFSCDCGLNGRARLVYGVVAELVKGRSGVRALLLERMTPLYGALKGIIGDLTGTEFFADTEAGADKWVGERSRGVRVRCESMMGFSYRDATFDLVMHFDVLEHVPDWRKGLMECRRILRPGAMLIMTFPFFEVLERNLVRTLVEDGTLRHVMPPAYHGNPLSSEGSLVYIHPSWEVIEALAEMGFEDVRVAWRYSVEEAIVSNGCPYPDGHMWPIVFVARRGSERRRWAPFALRSR